MSDASSTPSPTDTTPRWYSGCSPITYFVIGVLTVAAATVSYLAVFRSDGNSTSRNVPAQNVADGASAQTTPATIPDGQQSQGGAELAAVLGAFITYRDASLKELEAEKAVDMAGYCRDAASVLADPQTQVSSEVIASTAQQDVQGVLEQWNSLNDAQGALFTKCAQSETPENVVSSSEFSKALSAYKSASNQIAEAAGLPPSFSDVP